MCTLSRTVSKQFQGTDMGGVGGGGGGAGRTGLWEGHSPAMAPAKSRLPGLTCPSSFAKEAFT